MNLQEAKRIHNNWNKLIKEVTDQELKQIELAIDKATKSPNLLPLNQQFEGKLRVVVPVTFNALYDEGPLGESLNTLIAAGWKIDIETGIASKQVETEFEGIKRTQNKQMKFNAIWTTLVDLLTKHDKAFREAYNKNPNIADAAGYAAEDPVINKIESQITSLMGEAIGGKFIRDMAFKRAKEKIEVYIVIWQKEAAKIKNKMTGGSEYSVILSRHPIDVLRMSDFATIQSCHSPKSREGGGSYYSCAVAEARAGGAIAHLVRTEEIKGIDLEQREIFLDDTRGIDGIDPISRVRLRVLKQEDLNVSLAVPELKVYGPDIKGFTEAVTEWSLSKQGPQFEKILSLSENDEIDLSSFSMIGGSYQDNNITALFATLSKSVASLKTITLAGSIKHDNTTQSEIDKENMPSVIIEIDTIIEEFNENMLNNYRVPLRCEEDYYIEIEDSQLFIDPEIYFYYKLNPNLMTAKAAARLTEKMVSYIAEELKDFGLEKFVGIKSEYDEQLNQIKIFPSQSTFISFPIQNKDTLIEYLHEVYSEIRKGNIINLMNYIIESFLKREGFYEGGKLIELNNDLINQDIETEWDFKPDEDYESNPEMIEGEIGIVIPYAELEMSKQQAESVFGPKSLISLRHAIYGPTIRSETHEFIIDYDFDQNDVLLYFRIVLGKDAKDVIVNTAVKVIQIPKQELKIKIVGFLLKIANLPISSKTKLNEFKQVTTNWKNFLL